ncbi:S-methyl-5'-thioadenosine phosphorylase [Chromobacterium violaceum]|uniref:S-methyl-5'-thioadenosine phosphorylase n=1 Tax=Chromobacterium violaceum TaxID=536 RepID=A0A447T9H1_CHRVL|nr:S-methyl-5'-thioadenosine phosphorylase [Chromobacterium violaceum]
MTESHPARIGIIGGSGFQRLLGLTDSRVHHCATAFGAPSSPVTTGYLGGVPVAFLQRHGPAIPSRPLPSTPGPTSPRCAASAAPRSCR